MRRLVSCLRIAFTFAGMVARQFGDKTTLARLAALLITCALAGCETEIPAARQTSLKPMLARQPPPNCEYRRASLDKSGARQTEGQPTAADGEQNLVQRTKLDYERQCYRHAEIIARNRLRSLQNAVEVSAKPAKPLAIDPPSAP